MSKNSFDYSPNSLSNLETNPEIIINLSDENIMNKKVKSKKKVRFNENVEIYYFSKSNSFERSPKNHNIIKGYRSKIAG